MKNHDFTPKNHIFSNFRGVGGARVPPPLDPPLHNIGEHAPYVDSLKNKSDRSVLCKLRLSSHNLAIESDRYFIIPRMDRICEV